MNNFNVDRFGSMKAFHDDDLKAIQDRALQSFGSRATYNFIMVVVRDAVLSRYADAHPVRR